MSEEQINKLVAVAQAVAMLGAGAKISKDLAQVAAEAAGLTGGVAREQGRKL